MTAESTPARGPRPAGGKAAQKIASRLDVKTLASLMPYLWSANPPELRARVVLALVLLVGAMAANVSVY